MSEKIISAKQDAASSLAELFEGCLKDALWAENAMAEALPKQEANATSKKLKKALKTHLTQTKNQIKVLKSVFKSIGLKPSEEKCDAMAGIIDEGEGIMQETTLGSVRDAGIIAACQKAEHYEIASYGTMITYAKILKYRDAKKMLDGILKEEKDTDKLLSVLAMTEISNQAGQ